MKLLTLEKFLELMLSVTIGNNLILSRLLENMHPSVFYGRNNQQLKVLAKAAGGHSDGELLEDSDTDEKHIPEKNAVSESDTARQGEDDNNGGDNDGDKGVL
ncbi:hypothetical protein FQA39_LY00689 [Lamprigera yunnana]|nr:hypothetical protein FQA39_LY00689 [Lamprigera yunnana]